MYLCIDNDIPLVFGERDRNVKIVFLFILLLLIVNIHSFIYWWLLRLEAILKLSFIVLKLHAHHECDTLSNGNIVRNRMNHLSHNAENIKLCSKGWGDDNGVNLSIRIQAEVSQWDVSQSWTTIKLLLYLKKWYANAFNMDVLQSAFCL